MRKATDVFAILIGAFLLIEGILGLTSDVVFGVLTTNRTHAIIHIVLGLVGLLAGWKRSARGFCIFLGILLLAVGVLRFVPGVGQIIIAILNVNIAVAWVNIAIGAVALLVSLAGRNSEIRKQA